MSGSSDTTYSQDGRPLGFDSPLGQDNVILTELHGEDAISAPFRYDITFATTLESAAVRKLLGQAVTVWFGAHEADGKRPVNGLVRHLTGPAPGPRGFAIWQAVLVPQLAFLQYTQDCRIFQNEAVPDILRTVFKTYGLDHYEFRGLMGSYPPLTYCVQYRETAFAFVSRLMEHAGLFYWHEFTSGKHTLVIADSNHAAQPALADTAKLPSHSGFPDIDTLNCDFSFRPGKWTMTDYDFTAPSKALLSNTPTMLDEPAMSKYEVFDFPGTYDEQEHGNTTTRIRIEHEEMRYQTLSGTGRRAAFDAGRTVELDAMDAKALDVAGNKLLLTAVWHEAGDASFMTKNSGAEGTYYRNRFQAIPAGRTYRSALKTPKPVIQGVQCAVVVGPPGETIYTDEHGRVKVRFFWDRNPFSNPDENRSCWLRVSQSWADGKFGGVHLPRIGQEVIVDFLEGDPDRPMVTGRVYNGDKMHPYALPGSKTQSGFKTQSVGGTGWNEMRFEDMSGSEHVYLRSQKDHIIEILNDQTHTVGHDHSHSVTNDHNHKVGHDHNQNIGHDHNQTIENNYNVTVNNTQTVNITVDYNITTSGNSSTTTTGNSTKATAGSDTSTGPLKISAYGLGLNAYGAYLNTYGLKLDVPALNFTFYGIKGDFGLLKIDVPKWKIEIKDGKFQTSTTHWHAGAAFFQSVGDRIITAAVNMVIPEMFLIM